MSEQALYWRMEAEHYAMPGPFLKCPWPPCGHVFQTEAELVDTYNAWMTQLTEELIAKGWYPPDFLPVDDGDQIWLCPLCQHDFE